MKKQNVFLVLWLLIGISIFGSQVKAQNKGIFKIGVQGAIAFGTNNTKYPGGGALLDFKYFVSDRFTLSLTTGWQASTHHSLKQARVIIANVPIFAGTEFYFLKKSKIKPYIGVGLGTAFCYSQLSISTSENVLSNSTQKVEFASSWLMNINEKIGCEFEVHPHVALFAEFNCSQYVLGDFIDDFTMSFGLGARFNF
ncbi:MAG: OmpW family outer membrane protein [Bacteroidales bacterium]